MAATDSITLVKEFTYRGAPEEWSNTYHFGGVDPTTTAAWEALARAIWAEEKKVLRGTSKLVRAYGYNAGSVASVAQIDFKAMADQTGLTGINGDSGAQPAGDQAVWIRARIGTSSTGKKVYVRKYYHDVPLASSGGDTIHPLTVPRLTALATVLLAGTIGGGMYWRGPNDQIPVEPKVGPYVTTRTLKRRGKRP